MFAKILLQIVQTTKIVLLKASKYFLMKYSNAALIVSVVFCLGSCSLKQKESTTPIPSLRGEVTSSLHPGMSMSIREDSLKVMSKSNTPVRYQIEIPEYIPYSSPDTIYKSYHFIPLETCEESLVGNIRKILFLEKRIVITDRENENAYLFDREGKFLCKLGGKGRGPGEHLEVAGISYDETNGHIIVIDHYGGQFVHYSVDGEYIGEDPMFYHTRDVEFTKDRIVSLTGKFYNSSAKMLDLYQLVVADTLQKPLAVGYKTSDAVRSAFHFENELFKANGELFYHDILTDTLFAIKGDSIVPFLAAKFDRGPLFSQNEIQHMTDELYVNRINSTESVTHFFVTKNYVYITMSGNPKHISEPACTSGMIYSIQSGKTKRVEFVQAASVQRFGDIFARQGMGGSTDNNMAYNILPPGVILSEINSNHYKSVKLTPEEKAMVKTLTPESNPVLMIMEPVDF